MLALEFGEKYDSCNDAVIARAACPAGTTQKEWYEKYCERGDWLFWQLERLPIKKYNKIRPLVEQAVDIIVDRATTSMLVDIKDIDEAWAVHLRLWGAAWLDGTDRSRESARAAARTAWDVAWRVAWRVTESAERAAARTAWDVAWSAEWRTAWDVAWSAENKQKCIGIRKLIPTWPGE